MMASAVFTEPHFFRRTTNAIKGETRNGFSLKNLQLDVNIAKQGCSLTLLRSSFAPVLPSEACRCSVLLLRVKSVIVFELSFNIFRYRKRQFCKVSGCARIRGPFIGTLLPEGHGER